MESKAGLAANDASRDNPAQHSLDPAETKPSAPPEKESEKFDASQYAFFGGGDAPEIELGGLDAGNDDDGDGVDYDYGGLDYVDEVEEYPKNSPDVDELSNRLSKLGEDPWREAPNDKRPPDVSGIWKDDPSTKRQGLTESCAALEPDKWWLKQSNNNTSLEQSSDSLPSSSRDSSLFPPNQQQSIWSQTGRTPEVSKQQDIFWGVPLQDQRGSKQVSHSQGPPSDQSKLQSILSPDYDIAIKIPNGSSVRGIEGSMGNAARPVPAEPLIVQSQPLPSFAPPAPNQVPLSPNLVAAQAHAQAQAQWSQLSVLQSLMARPGSPLLYQPSQISHANQVAQAALAQAQMRIPQVPPHLTQQYQRVPVQTPQMHIRPLQPGPAPMNHFFPTYPPSADQGAAYSQDTVEAQRARGNFQNYSTASQQQNHNGPAMRSKYMTVEDIESVVRMQWAATHSSDPYLDDYYHQAIQAKLGAENGTPHGRRHFAPSALRDLTTRARGNPERHSFVQIEGLGRIPLSSIRRPRPLLDVESASFSTGEDGENSARPLEQEPMLAARIAIEDGLSLILDVDDIDRMTQVTQSSEVINQLQKRRQALLHSLASSLQLSDPLMQQNAMFSNEGINPRDDIVFLRIASLPKGRKMIVRFLRLLPPGSDLQRVLIMAIFRHLRFLFGGAQSDSGSTTGLANTVVFATPGLSLSTLSACLAAAALSQEQLHLRSLGMGGDGGTMVLCAVLDRATILIKEQGPALQQSAWNSWQAAFNLFFNCLSKFLCFDTILKALPLPPQVAAEVSKEIPLEVLRSALPHTSQAQKQQVGALLQGLLRSA